MVEAVPRCPEGIGGVDGRRSVKPVEAGTQHACIGLGEEQGDTPASGRDEVAVRGGEPTDEPLEVQAALAAAKLRVIRPSRAGEGIDCLRWTSRKCKRPPSVWSNGW